MSYALLNRFILVFIGLFVVVDPLAAVPMILGLTKEDSPDEIARIARRACWFGAGILLFFSVFGTSIFRFLQIDLSAFRAAGGLLLLITAIGMLRNKPRLDGDPSGAAGTEPPDLSVFPFATPLLAGPGAITSVVVFATDKTLQQDEQLMILGLAIALVFLITYFVLRAAVPIKRFLGRSGVTVVQQMMGLLLAAISLQFLVQGLVPLVKGIWAS